MPAHAAHAAGAGINLVIWGDPQRVYRANDIQGLNTGVFLLRKCEWSRQLMAEVAALATPSIRRQIGNKGRIAEQGALTWVLHSQAAKWKDRCPPPHPRASTPRPHGHA